jgi:hypothetical protein
MTIVTASFLSAISTIDFQVLPAAFTATGSAIRPACCAMRTPSSATRPPSSAAARSSSAKSIMLAAPPEKPRLSGTAVGCHTVTTSARRPANSEPARSIACMASSDPS